MSKDPGYSDSKKDTLESRNRFLEACLKTIESRVEALNQVNDGLHSAISKLKEENEKLVEALKFYADKGNWKSNGMPSGGGTIIAIQIIKDDHEKPALSTCGGKRARQVLKEMRDK